VSESIWTILGTAPTTDPTEIRRAYARRLKAIDVDAHPEAFIALRGALERALAEARARQVSADEATWHPDDDFGGDEPPYDPLPLDTAGDEAAARFIALEALLFPAEADAPAPDPAALDAALDAILAHPEMAAVDHNASVEAWLAELVYHSAPRSDPILPAVAAFFRWEERAGAWDNPYLLEALAERLRAMHLLAEVAEPHHKFHSAWRDLTSDRPSLGLASFGRGRAVRRFLETIRSQCPPAEAALNPHRLALWEERRGPRLDRDWLSRGWFGIVLLFMALRVVAGGFAGGGGTPTGPVPSIAERTFTDPALDLDPFVEQASNGRYDLLALGARNPGLHERLIARWEQARAGTDNGVLFGSDIRTLLEQGMHEGLRYGSFALQRDYWRLRADELIALRTRDPEACVRAMTGEGAVPAPSGSIQMRRREIELRALAEPPRDPDRPGMTPAPTFRIPAPIASDAARRSGLPFERLRAAINDRGPAADRCAAEIGLIEAALAAPRRSAAPLLRDMSRGL
jgi:hypothetical protein